MEKVYNEVAVTYFVALSHHFSVWTRIKNEKISGYPFMAL
jgi:hypothetical protein